MCSKSEKVLRSGPFNVFLHQKSVSFPKLVSVVHGLFVLVKKDSSRRLVMPKKKVVVHGTLKIFCVLKQEQRDISNLLKSLEHVFALSPQFRKFTKNKLNNMGDW